MIRITVLLAVLLSLSACSDDASSTLPAATSFTLSGIVFNGGFGVAGVSVAIMDGVHAGQTRTTDNAGRFSFTNLTPSAFTLRATATYAAQNKSVNLTTSDQSVNFDLPDH